MKITVTPFGELTFGRYLPSAGDILKVPHSRPFTARGAGGSFFCQVIQAREYHYCYSVLRPAEDVTIHYQQEEARPGFRLVLKQHIRDITGAGEEVPVKQGQFHVGQGSPTNSAVAVKKGREYVLFDMYPGPPLMKRMYPEVTGMDRWRQAVEARVAGRVAGSAWATIPVLDAVERILRCPYWVSAADEVVRAVIQAAGQQRSLIDLTEDRIESLFQVREQIRANVRCHRFIPELARRAGMNAQYFKMGFRQVFGMTPFQYLEYERVKEAKRLLRETNWTVRHIAQHTGFAEASSFIRMFIKAMSVSPREWRLQVR